VKTILYLCRRFHYRALVQRRGNYTRTQLILITASIKGKQQIRPVCSWYPQCCMILGVLQNSRVTH